MQLLATVSVTVRSTGWLEIGSWKGSVVIPAFFMHKKHLYFAMHNYLAIISLTSLRFWLESDIIQPRIALRSDFPQRIKNVST